MKKQKSSLIQLYKLGQVGELTLELEDLGFSDEKTDPIVEEDNFRPPEDIRKRYVNFILNTFEKDVEWVNFEVFYRVDSKRTSHTSVIVDGSSRGSTFTYLVETYTRYKWKHGPISASTKQNAPSGIVNFEREWVYNNSFFENEFKYISLLSVSGQYCDGQKFAFFHPAASEFKGRKEFSIENLISQNSCFVATAAFDDQAHPVVQSLRDFRDKSLTRSKIGLCIVKVYYLLGPSAARVLNDNSWAKPAVRAMLAAFAALIRSKNQ